MSRYRFVEAESSRYPVTRLCRIAQVSRGELPDRAAEECIWARLVERVHWLAGSTGSPLRVPSMLGCSTCGAVVAPRIGHDQAA